MNIKETKKGKSIEPLTKAALAVLKGGVMENEMGFGADLNPNNVGFNPLAT